MADGLKVAVVGCGTAGLAVASFLKSNNNHPIIFERFHDPQPLGSGLLLQPTGLACLARLGLDIPATQLGQKVTSLYGETTSGRTIFDVSYKTLRSHCFGLGIHRGTLFDVLYRKAQSLDIPIETGRKIVASRVAASGRTLIDEHNEEFGPFDLVIDASGMRSKLRIKELVKINKPYPYGAVWGVVDDPGQTFGGSALQQKYDKASVMIGMLPIGCEPSGGDEKCAFFWSLPVDSYEAWKKSDFNAWKSEVVGHWPEIGPYVNQFKSHDDLTFAYYHDIVLKKYDDDRIVFIGDSAHNTSPQLGQGANMALADAFILSKLLLANENVNAALNKFSDVRKNQIGFYQRASRYLTPFFQSDYDALASLRDVVFSPLCHTPIIGTEMLRTLAGLKTSLFSHMNPGEWHHRYDIDIER